MPVVLIPTHKSHIDYIVMSIICFHYNLPLPYIAAGDNLNIPIIGYLFKCVMIHLADCDGMRFIINKQTAFFLLLPRRAGAFFIRREFSGDPLYSLLFRCYLEQILNEGTLYHYHSSNRQQAARRT